MGGKRLKFPKRKKFIAGDSVQGEVEEKPVSEEEHKKRIELLKSLGLVKSESGSDTSASNSEEKKE